MITDYLGSVRLVVDASTGAVQQRLEYDEYGRVTTNTSVGFQPFGYAGGILDGNTGLVRFGQRDYTPSLGSWTTTDPLGFRGGDANVYRYASSDPVNRVDPEGMNPLLIAAIGGAVGAGFRGWKEYLEQCRKVNGQVLRSIGAGFVGGFAATLIGQLGGASMGVFFNAAGAATGGVLGTLITESIAGYTPTPNGIVTSTLIGGAFGAVRGPVSEILQDNGVGSTLVRQALTSSWKAEVKQLLNGSGSSKCNECAH